MKIAFINLFYWNSLCLLLLHQNKKEYKKDTKNFSLLCYSNSRSEGGFPLIKDIKIHIFST